MNGVYLSFYLKIGRIHIYTEALHQLGDPGRVCFLLAPDGRTLLLRAHGRRGFTSQKIPRDVYTGSRSFDISSHKLCGILAGLHGWDPARSYRVPGVPLAEPRAVQFFLTRAEAIT